MIGLPIAVGFWLRLGALALAAGALAWGVWAFCDWQQGIGAARVQKEWDATILANARAVEEMQRAEREKETKAGLDREAKDAAYVAQIENLQRTNAVLAADGQRLHNSLATALHTLRNASPVSGTESPAYAAAEQLGSLYARADRLAEERTNSVRELETQIAGLQEYAASCHRFTLGK